MIAKTRLDLPTDHYGLLQQTIAIMRRCNRYAIALDEIAHRAGLTADAMRVIAQHALSEPEEPRR